MPQCAFVSSFERPVRRARSANLPPSSLSVPRADATFGGGEGVPRRSCRRGPGLTALFPPGARCVLVLGRAVRRCAPTSSLSVRFAEVPARAMQLSMNARAAAPPAAVASRPAVGRTRFSRAARPRVSCAATIKFSKYQGLGNDFILVCLWRTMGDGAVGGRGREGRGSGGEEKGGASRWHAAVVGLVGRAVKAAGGKGPRR